MFRTILVLALVCVAVAFGPAKFSARSGRVSLSMKNIVETAAAAGKFNTLIAAVKAAKLEGALSGSEKLTVFAPTDAAFAKLPAGTVDALLKDIPKLTNLLLFHVVKGEALPTRNGRTFNTLLNGGDGFPKELSVKITVGQPVQSLIWGGQERPANVETYDSGSVKCANSEQQDDIAKTDANQ